MATTKTQVIYCEPPHSKDSEFFEIELSGSYTIEYSTNGACSFIFQDGMIPPPPEPINADIVPNTCVSKIVGCAGCEGFEGLLYNETLVDPVVYIEFRNAVVGWTYHYNLLVSREKHISHITGIEEGTSNCTGYAEREDLGTTVYPIEFTPSESSGKIGPISLSGFSGGCMGINLEYVSCA